MWSRLAQPEQHGWVVDDDLLWLEELERAKIEPKWVHGKRAASEPARMLSADELEQRVCSYYGCDREAHLTMPEKVA